MRGLIGLGLDVPYTDVTGAPGVADVQPHPPYCNDPKGLQQMLADLGLYAGNIDGLVGDQTFAAIIAFRESQGLPTAGGMDSATCQGIMDAWSARSAGATPGAAIFRARTLAALRRAQAAAAPTYEPTPAPTAPAPTGPMAVWQRQSTVVKAALVVAGLAAVGAVGYYVYTKM